MTDTLSSLKIEPAEVPELPASARSSLIAYLLRWEYYEDARRCLRQLLITHSHLVTVYDDLARAELGAGQPERALEMLERRHAIKVSNSSRILQARAHLAAGQLAEAQALAAALIEEAPTLLTGWSLQADVCLAAGDPDGAEIALQRREAIAPETASTALGLARVWQARADLEKALLWARTALSRTERDEHQAPVDLLRLLEALYSVTGQPAQAEAMDARLRQREQQEMESLRRDLGLALPVPAPRPAPRHPQPVQAATAPPAVILTPEEKEQLAQALHRYFPHAAFREGQAEAIAPVLRGESVLAVMPTGAGKSLCYQLAAMLLPGTTLVISPLVALMKDQLDNLPDLVAARATTLNYTLEGAELEARVARAAAGGYKLLYAAPERLRQRPFLHALTRAGVSLLVVDEAHCVSLWGHDFRPDYLFIVKAWQELGRPPIMALTATATPRVRDDIQAALGQMRLVATDVHRPNLRLEAHRFSGDPAKTRALIELCTQMEGSGIVYANSRARCEELAADLRRAGVNAIHYHAGVDDRAAAQDRFMSGQARVVVATIAFGMGIDKPDVRFIIHFHPPRTLENYYQEAGRAGRDGLPSRCILFHSTHDKGNLTHWARQDALSVEFLRQVYTSIQRRLGEARLGLVALADLERDLAAEETALRVAIHFLETAGLLWRGFDLPRMATLTLRRLPAEPDGALLCFVQAARLRPGEPIARDLMAVARDASRDLRTLEASLLAWADAGWLDYRGSGRDMLLSLPPAPPDSRERVSALLADYVSGQDGRIGEIMGYAAIRLCRHGYISAYFGGRPIERCNSCDNCLGTASRASEMPAVPRPAPAVAVDPQWAVLRGVERLPYPLGARNLARALVGANSSRIQADRFPLFGVLAGRTHKSVGELIAGLVEEGLLAYFERGEYRLLRLTDAGQAWLRAHPQPDPLPTATPAAETLAAPQPQTPRVQAPISDEVLLERLRAWRLQVARENGVAPYMVLTNSSLSQVAAEHPASTEQLLAVKGIGRRKAEQYGAAVLDIVAGREPEPVGPPNSVQERAQE
jgi:ATP-dependent DNA helicase RecQ